MSMKEEIEKLKLKLSAERRFRKEDGMSAAMEQGRLWQENQYLKNRIQELQKLNESLENTVQNWRQNFIEAD